MNTLRVYKSAQKAVFLSWYIHLITPGNVKPSRNGQSFREIDYSLALTLQQADVHLR
jgi:hypothetical protein